MGAVCKIHLVVEGFSIGVIIKDIFCVFQFFSSHPF